MKKIIVTGATSLIGAALIEECVQRGVQVLALVREGSDRLGRLPQSELVTAAVCDINYLGAYEPAACDYDAFYHFAWQGTDKRGRRDAVVQQRNIQNALDAVALAKRTGCRHFIGAGSQGEYGAPMDGRTAPDTAANPNDAYGVGKYAAGKLCGMLAAALGMDFSWVRIFSVYGPYMLPEGVLPVMIRRLLAGEHCAFTEATQIWDFLDYRDAGRALYLVGEKATGSHVYCLGSGVGRPLREYLETVRDIIDPSAVLGFGEIPYADGRANNVCADISALTRDTGWTPELEFSQGVRDMTDSLRRQPALSDEQ